LDNHAAGLRQLFETLREYHPHAGDSVVCNYHLAETYTDPKSRLNVILKPRVGVSVPYLERDRSSHRIRRPSELCYEGISSYFLGDASIGTNNFGETSKAALKALVRYRFVTLDELRRADYVSMENDGEFACRVVCQKETLFFGYWG
jgi:hypothetical protein